MTFLDHWAIQQSPFARPRTAETFFSGKPQREAIARLNYMVDSGQSTAMLLGGHACGSTTLLQQIATSAGFGDTAVDVALTECHGLSADDCLQSLASQINASEQGPSLWQRVSDRTRASGRQHVRTLWLIDGASTDVAEMAGTLTSQNRWITAIVCTQPERAKTIASALGSYPLRMDLGPLDLRDTIRYVRNSIAAAGTDKEIFTDGAIVRLHELSEGRIGIISRLAELSMLASAGHELHSITPDMVDAVRDEFVQAA